MNVFTEVYDKSVAILQARPFQQRWSNLEPKLRGLFASGGPNAGDADALELVRSRFKGIAKASPDGQDAVAAEVLKLSDTEKPGYQDRAAFLKLLQHFYFCQSRGSQSVWVVDHPVDYAHWCYRELESQTEAKVETLLEKNHEVFGPNARRVMPVSLQLTRKWSMDVQAKLATADSTTKAKVKRWFLAADASDEDIRKTIATLTDGFKKISAVCNSTTVIFADRPPRRSAGTADHDLASVNSQDRMPVVYLYRLFLREQRKARGEIGLLWYCALTLVHELSHKLQKTKDLSYDFKGLKPGGVSLSVANAIRNADSWAYFAADIVGALTKAKLDEVYV